MARSEVSRAGQELQCSSCHTKLPEERSTHCEERSKSVLVEWKTKDRVMAARTHVEGDKRKDKPTESCCLVRTRQRHSAQLRRGCIDVVE